VDVALIVLQDEIEDDALANVNLEIHVDSCC